MLKRVAIYVSILASLLLAGGLYLELNNNSTDKLTEVVTSQQNSGSDLKNLGQAPEFAGIKSWLNSDPLTIEQLRGKVILIDFWTYSCINCIRTLPYVTGWYEKYKDNGFVVIGVHTPEFAFEKDEGNVRSALSNYKINYPVALDNDYGTWQAYKNKYWPAHYLIDQNGDIVYTHFGEGQYRETEQAIQNLLGLQTNNEMEDTNIARQVKTPEIYFGLDRIQWLTKEQKASPTTQSYSLPSQLADNYFALSGQWLFSNESVRLISNSGKIRLNFYSKDVHMVAQSASNAMVKVYIDGQFVKTVEIKNSNLYTLFEGNDSAQRMMDIEIEGDGFEAFTFTFG